MKLLIIGAGPGGYETALAAAKRGVEVVLVEAGPVGGTCLNEGCIPTKSFCKNAQLLEQLREAEAFGVSDLAYNFDFKAVTARKNAVVEQLRGGVESLLSHKLITLVRGKASFKDPHTVVVGDEEYSADYIIIATGSVSASLPVPGADLEGILTSKEILDIEELPKKLCVIGGGVIGLEFASIFNSFSCEVTVLEYCKEILPRFDTDLAKRLKQCLGKGNGKLRLRKAFAAGNGHTAAAAFIKKAILQHLFQKRIHAPGLSVALTGIARAVGRAGHTAIAQGAIGDRPAPCHGNGALGAILHAGAAANALILIKADLRLEADALGVVTPHAF